MAITPDAAPAPGCLEKLPESGYNPEVLSHSKPSILALVFKDSDSFPLDLPMPKELCPYLHL